MMIRPLCCHLRGRNSCVHGFRRFIRSRADDERMQRQI
jgi:hypothetical protein